MYQAHCFDSDSIKKSTKGSQFSQLFSESIEIYNLGVPHENVFTMEDFLKCLLESKRGENIEIRSLRCHQNNMTRQSVLKKGLSPYFTKMCVQSDSVTCLPLSENGSFI